MAPLDIDAYIQKNACEHSEGTNSIDLALTDVSILLEDKKLLAAGHASSQALEMEHQPIVSLFHKASQSLSLEDQTEYNRLVPAKDFGEGPRLTALHHPNIWSGFLHATLAHLNPKSKLQELQGSLSAIQSETLQKLLETPIVCAPGKLHYAKGSKNPKDRPKIILNLELDDSTKARIRALIALLSNASGVTCDEKFHEPHVIVAKNYGERGQRPDDGLLERLGKAIQAMGVTFSWGRITAAARGDNLGYCLDIRRPLLIKCPLALWQVGPDGSQELPTQCLWLPGYKEAKQFRDIVKGQAAPCQAFVQAVHNRACAGEDTTVGSLCTTVDLSSFSVPRPPTQQGNGGGMKGNGQHDSHSQGSHTGMGRGMIPGEWATQQSRQPHRTTREGDEWAVHQSRQAHRIEGGQSVHQSRPHRRRVETVGLSHNSQGRWTKVGGADSNRWR